MPVQEKIDLYKLHKSEYVMPKEPALVDVKPAKYLTIEGRGEPGGEDFQARVGALYGAAYTIKMARKQAGRDYKVCSLEGQWWGDDPGVCFAGQPKSTWRWKLMIRVPDFITERDLKSAVGNLESKGKSGPTGDIRLETIEEGKCVQALHVGPYDREGDTVSRMSEAAGRAGLAFRGLHHEIYLSDPRRVAPERLRTLLRQPVG